MSTVFGPTARCRGPALPIAATSARTGLLHNAARRPKQPCHCKLRQFCDAQYKLPLRRSTEGLARKAMWARFAAGTRFSAQFGLLRRKSCACFPHLFQAISHMFSSDLEGHAPWWPCARRYRTRRSASLQNTLPATRRSWRATLRGGRVPGAIGRDGARPSKAHCRPRAEPGGPRSVVAVRPALSDATERVPPKHIAGHAPNLEGHAPSWPCALR